MGFHLSLNTETLDAVYPKTPLVVEPETSVSDVLRLMKVERSGSVLVCRDGVLVGIFTERDALRLMAAAADLQVAISQVMVAKPVTVESHQSVAHAIRTMSDGGYRRLPVVDKEGRPVGVIVVTGIVHFLVEHFPETVYNLPPQPEPMTQDREGA